MHCICMAYGCELQVGTMFVVLCIPLYYYQPGEFLCSGTDAPMCSLLHLLHVPCSAMYKCFGVWLCLPVQCYGPLFSWSIQLPLGFVCSAHVGGHNPGTLGGVGLVVSWYTRVTKSSSFDFQRPRFESWFHHRLVAGYQTPCACLGACQNGLGWPQPLVTSNWHGCNPRWVGVQVLHVADGCSSPWW